ncbi:MAG: hypothetical protein FJ301_12515 [Planctomycetes bacterium]|nr:hypothetical protein [Planctomycetota bacterium]
MLPRAGPQPDRRVVGAAGGAELRDNAAAMAIGCKNQAIPRQALAKNGVALTAEDTGGNTPRPCALDLQNGTVVVRAKDGDKSLWAHGSALTLKPATPCTVAPHRRRLAAAADGGFCAVRRSDLGKLLALAN